jgi:ubiquinone biosynthesis protein Coq4
LLEAYQRGREAESLIKVIWEDQWAEPLDRVRERYNVRPLERRWLD